MSRDVPFVYTNTLLKVLCKRANKFDTMECPNQLLSSRVCANTDICTWISLKVNNSKWMPHIWNLLWNIDSYSSFLSWF